jgi:hypothetical protein
MRIPITSILGFFLLVTSLLGTKQSSAQDYVSGIGLRGGFASGITFKHFYAQGRAFEVIAQQRFRGFGLTGLLEWQQAIPNSTPGLDWFYGVGGHIGGYDSRYPGVGEGGDVLLIGVDAIIGLEYSIPDFPIALSVDWKPRFSLIGSSRFVGDGGALSLRYTF